MNCCDESTIVGKLLLLLKNSTILSSLMVQHEKKPALCVIFNVDIDKLLFLLKITNLLNQMVQDEKNLALFVFLMFA